MTNCSTKLSRYVKRDLGRPTATERRHWGVCEDQDILVAARFVDVEVTADHEDTGSQRADSRGRVFRAADLSRHPDHAGDVIAGSGALP